MTQISVFRFLINQRYQALLILWRHKAWYDDICQKFKIWAPNMNAKKKFEGSSSTEMKFSGWAYYSPQWHFQKFSVSPTYLLK